MLKAALDYLEHISKTTPIYFFKSAVANVRLDSGRFFTTGKKGCPDITLLYEGVFYGIEIKVGKDRQRNEQKKAQQEIETAGGKYLICHDSLKALRETIRKGEKNK